MENKHNEKCGFELNHQGECVFSPKEPIRCTFNQTTKFTSLIPPHDEHFEQIQCENITEEQFDEYGRAYCKEHRIKVDEINKSRHKNCINKEKLIEYINKKLKEVDRHSYNIWVSGYINGLEELKKIIENGEFDNE